VTGRGIVWQVRAEPGAGLRGGVRGQGRRGGGELNLRQLCVHRVANESGHPWTWWDYKIRCSMKEKYSNACAEDVVTALDRAVSGQGAGVHV
jgi:hypothetical protein